MSRDIDQATSYWLSPNALKNLVEHYLQKVCGASQQYILGEKPLKTLRLSQEARQPLLREFASLPRQTSPIFRNWEIWLKGTNPYLSVTFDAATAIENPDATFLMPLHPLVRQAAAAFNLTNIIVMGASVCDTSVPPGDYRFSIYEWRFHGIREDLVLRPICQENIVAQDLVRLLEKAEPLILSSEEVPDPVILAELDRFHHDLWSAARRDHQNQTFQLAGYRRESLTRSHAARKTQLEDQLERTSEEKIRRMRNSQLASAEADYSRHLQEVEEGVKNADLTFQPVAYGLIRVKRGRSDGQ